MNTRPAVRVAQLFLVAALAASCRDAVSPRQSRPEASPATAAVRITGLGKITTPDGVAISFNFDVGDDLTGRFTASDSSDVRPNGGVGTLTVDANDSGTRFSAFRSTSTLCSDPTQGAEIDGTGREDTGGLVDFTAAVCDGGPSGSGLDRFRIAIPIESYDRSGPVTSGDITKTTASSSNQPPSVDAGPDETQLLALLYSLHATFGDPDNDGPWSYTISWGDGSSTSGATASQGAIDASHTYLLFGSYTITVTVTDSHGAAGSDSKVLQVVL